MPTKSNAVASVDNVDRYLKIGTGQDLANGRMLKNLRHWSPYRTHTIASRDLHARVVTAPHPEVDGTFANAEPLKLKLGSQVGR